jgi:anti-sigma B factor antagonist
MEFGSETQSSIRTLVPEGDIDHENVSQFTGALQSVVKFGGGPIVVDLSKVTYVDSAGIGAIYDLIERLNGGREIELTGVSSDVWRIFEVSGLTTRHGVRILPEGNRSEGQAGAARPSSEEWVKEGTITQSFAGRLDELQHIRSFVADRARAALLDEARIFNLQVAVSEAAANAIEHGLPAGDVELSASRWGGRLTITVTHPGHFLPRLKDDPLRSHRGMGLPLMLALTDEVLVKWYARLHLRVSGTGSRALGNRSDSPHHEYCDVVLEFTVREL